MGVTIDDFERYLKLNKDARGLQCEISALRQKNNNLVKDKVKGSKKKHPYNEQHIPIEGIAYNSRAIKQRERELASKRAEMLTLGARIEGFLKTVEDIEVRDILILHYIDGITYRQLPQYLGQDGDGSYLMRRAKAYLKSP